MKDFKFILISFVLLIFMIGAVSAIDVNSTDDAVTIAEDAIIADNPTTNEIYVNDTGDDSNTGAEESPYASIKMAVDGVNSSQETIIHLSQGTFAKDNDTSFTFNFNHKADGGNLTIIGAGADKTIIDGQSAFQFATIQSNSIITIKDLTFVNFKSYNGAVFYDNGGILTIENCIFKDCYNPGSNGGAIYGQGNNANLTVKNSVFDACSVAYNNAGAIYAYAMNRLYLDNNKFVNTKINSGSGVAVYSAQITNSYIYNNEFINLTGNSEDASILVNPVFGNNRMSYVINNTFINCSNPSTYGSIVSLSYGYNVFKNNTFINSSNSNGNIYANGAVEPLIFNVENTLINVGNNEVNNGVVIPINNITDDNGNLVKTSAYIIKLTGETNNYTFSPNINGNITSIRFNNVPENGLYNLSIIYYNNQYSTDVLATVNISTSNDPIELYVSPEGSDANNGTKEFPFETIQYAIDTGFEKSFTVIVHLLKGTYSGKGNVELNIANKGTLQIIGEKYGETIIDGNNTNWILSISTTIANIENLSFINGKSTSRNLISGGTYTNCIFDNNTVSSTSYYVISISSILDNVTYTNNYGRISTSNSIFNSYFANNEFIDLNYGGIIYIQSHYYNDFIIENCTFFNNTATRGGVIFSNAEFVSRNNNYSNNKASDFYYERTYESACYGVIYTTGIFTSENDTFENNHGYINGVIGFNLNNQPSSNPSYTFTCCKFINNSAYEGGVIKLRIGSFTDCEFINNSADYGGVFSLLPANANSIYSLELVNVTFDNNKANIFGNDIYFAPKNNWYSGDNYIYAIDLTINFNDLNTSSLVDDVTANVVAPCGANVAGNTINFFLDNTKIGSAEIIDGYATLNYAGFENGVFNLTGYANYASPSSIVNNGTVNVTLEDILDSVTFYVSVNGSDEEGNGSETNPYKSISYAVKEASKNCRNIVINIGEGTYSGNLNTALTLSSLSNITLNGTGIDKTVLDGENLTYLAKITNGKNLIVISNLTIQNMLPNNRESRTIDVNNPITVEEGANLLLDTVNVNNNHGGEAIIVNNGNLFIENSVFTKNGYSNKGIISGGNISIDNTSMVDNFEKQGLIRGDLIILTNSEIKNAFNYDPTNYRGGVYSLILGEYLIIENTKISNDGNNCSLEEFGYTETNSIAPAVAIESYNVEMNNVSMIYNYGSPTTVVETPSVSQSTYLSAFGYVYGWYPKNLTVTNSSFENYKYLWVVNTYYDTNFTFDECYFNNLTNIAYSLTITQNSAYLFNNSVFINVDPVINRESYTHRPNPVIDFNNNYWGNNSQPVIKYMNGAVVVLENIPDTWIALYSEDNETIIKNVTDGENSTAYTGNAPIRTDYADNHGNLGYAVVFGDVGYIIATDNETNVILNPENEIYPFVAADPMDYRTPSTIAITGFAGDLGIVCVLVDPVGNPIANATILSIINGENVANVTTDANGAFTVKGIKNGVLTLLFNGTDDYFDTEYNLTFTDAGKTTKSFIYLNIIEADLAVKGTLVDDEGSPIANAVITYTINGENATNVTTDTDGVFQVQGAANSIVDIVFAGSEGADAANTTLVIKDVAPTVVRLGSQFNVTEGVSIKTYAVDSKAGEVGQTTSFKLTDSNGNPIVNATVKFAYKTVILNRTTDENGIVFIGINTQLAQEALCAMSYLGDENYNATFVAFSFDIQKKPITITAPAKTYKASVKTKKYTVTLKTEKCNSLDGKVYLSAGKKVTMKINGKTYTAKTNANGQATFNLKITKKGKLSGTVKFDGDKTYASASKSVKITIK